MVKKGCRVWAWHVPEAAVAAQHIVAGFSDELSIHRQYVQSHLQEHILRPTQEQLRAAVTSYGTTSPALPTKGYLC